MPIDRLWDKLLGAQSISHLWHGSELWHATVWVNLENIMPPGKEQLGRTVCPWDSFCRHSHWLLQGSAEVEAVLEAGQYTGLLWLAQNVQTYFLFPFRGTKPLHFSLKQNQLSIVLTSYESVETNQTAHHEWSDSLWQHGHLPPCLWD